MKVSLIRPSKQTTKFSIQPETYKQLPFHVLLLSHRGGTQIKWLFLKQICLQREVSWSIDRTERACTFLCAGQPLPAHVHSVFWVQFVRVQGHRGAVISPADCCILTPSPRGAWAHPKALEVGRGGNGTAPFVQHRGRQGDWPGHSVSRLIVFRPWVCFSAGCWTVPWKATGWLWGALGVLGTVLLCIELNWSGKKQKAQSALPLLLVPQVTEAISHFCASVFPMWTGEGALAPPYQSLLLKNALWVPRVLLVCLSAVSTVTVKDKLKSSSKAAAHGYLHNNTFFCCFILPFTAWFEHSRCSRHYTHFEVWSIFPAEIQVSCSDYTLKRFRFITIPHEKQDMRSANLLKSI